MRRLILLFTAAISSCFAQGSAGIIATWTQMGTSANVLARAIVSGSSCPNITLDGQTQQMGVRAQPNPPTFPVMSCETTIPSGTGSASIQGQQLALPNPNPAQFVVWGDTGCRMAAGNPFQACNDPNAWPTGLNASTASFTFPDLIIHMGDLHYREIPCPVGNTGCAGSPFGFGWDVWNADFFTPAQPLLNVAPWIFIRGNHEYCDKAFDGWFRFLDPYPYQPGCQQFTNPYSVMAGGLQLIVFDSAGANDTSAPANTDTKLWRTQRAAWSIKEVICTQAYWGNCGVWGYHARVRARFHNHFTVRFQMPTTTHSKVKAGKVDIDKVRR
jgi:Calcineurin-like phosphoesterase